MVRQNKQNIVRRKQIKRRARPFRRFRTITSSRNGGSSNFLGYMNFARTLISSLPVSGLSKILALFDFAFNLIISTLATNNYYRGAYSMFGITPAALLVNSPLLAQTNGGLSFPGYPVSMKWLKFRITSTTKNAEKSGRWAAVYIPYIELHDADHYTKVIKDLTYAEVVSMPHSKSGTANKDLHIMYRMNDKTAYCARPREITEDIGLLYIIWDTSSSDSFANAPVNSVFNCEIEVQGGCVPHVIFGPTHRTEYALEKFKLHAITQGDSARYHHEDGTIEHILLADADMCDSFSRI